MYTLFNFFQSFTLTWNIGLFKSVGYAAYGYQYSTFICLTHLLDIFIFNKIGFLIEFPKTNILQKSYRKYFYLTNKNNVDKRLFEVNSRLL